jgi:copper chaperone CopZ
MCKKKIEKAAKSVDGIKSAKWNVVNGNMKVKFDTNKTTSDAIQSAIAAVGYDTENYRAKDEVYENLHYCCKYERTIKKE